jgi:hypothetical protein
MRNMSSNMEEEQYEYGHNDFVSILISLLGIAVEVDVHICA